MRNRLIYGVFGLVIALAVAGCLDLEVPNVNDPDRERALDDPGDVETLIASSWLPYWRRTQSHGWPYYILQAVGGVHMTSVANSGAMVMSEMPRPAFDNNPVSGVQGLARWPYFDFYSALDSANDGLRQIANGMEFGSNGQDTERARAFAKFNQGLMLSLLAMQYDKAFVAKEDTDLDNLEFQPYQEVLEAGIASFEEAIQIAQANSFEIPRSWVPAVPALSSDRLVKLAHTMIGRFLIYSARYPEDRQALDWNRIINHLEAGYRETFAIEQIDGDLNPSWFRRRHLFNAFGAYRGWSRFLGKADLSGNYQTNWLDRAWEDRVRWDIETPDRRITAGPPDSDGKYWRYLERSTVRDERGTYRQSNYQYSRYSEWRNTVLPVISEAQIDLLLAEAYARSGRTQEAVDLTNKYRVANGELPPVTATGVPQSEDCVPRTDQGECLDLLGAIWYERQQEATLQESTRDWWDNRGWGMLEEGTFVQLPVTGRELETLGEPIYTFGGVGGESAAAAPRW